MKYDSYVLFIDDGNSVEIAHRRRLSVEHAKASIILGFNDRGCWVVKNKHGSIGQHVDARALNAGVLEAAIRFVNENADR